MTDEVIRGFRVGEWVRCFGSNFVSCGDHFLGTVLRVTSGGSMHVRCVVNGIEGVRTCTEGADHLSLLEILAAESVSGYWPNPNIRICENEDCTRILDKDWTAVYCSNRCALGDA